MVGVVGSRLAKVLAAGSPWCVTGPPLDQFVTAHEPQLVQGPPEASRHRRGRLLVAEDGIGDSTEEAGEASAELSIEEERVDDPIDTGAEHADRDGHRPVIETEAGFHDAGVSLKGRRQDGENVLQVLGLVPMPMHPGDDNPPKAAM